MLPGMMQVQILIHLSCTLLTWWVLKQNHPSRIKPKTLPTETNQAQVAAEAAVPNNSPDTSPPPTNTKQEKSACKMNNIFVAWILKVLLLPQMTTMMTHSIFLVNLTLFVLTDVNYGACPMENDDHSFNNLLKCWKTITWNIFTLQVFLENSSNSVLICTIWIGLESSCENSFLLPCKT